MLIKFIQIFAIRPVLSACGRCYNLITWRCTLLNCIENLWSERTKNSYSIQCLPFVFFHRFSNLIKKTGVPISIDLFEKNYRDFNGEN